MGKSKSSFCKKRTYIFEGFIQNLLLKVFCTVERNVNFTFYNSFYVLYFSDDHLFRIFFCLPFFVTSDLVAINLYYIVVWFMYINLSITNFSEVWMAKHRENAEIVALKKIRMENEKEGVWSFIFNIYIFVYYIWILTF